MGVYIAMDLANVPYTYICEIKYVFIQYFLLYMNKEYYIITITIAITITIITPRPLWLVGYYDHQCLTICLFEILYSP